MDEKALAQGLEDAVWYSEAPVPDVNGVGRLAMAELAHSKGIKVVLTGQLFQHLLELSNTSIQARDLMNISLATPTTGPSLCRNQIFHGLHPASQSARRSGNLSRLPRVPTHFFLKCDHPVIPPNQHDECSILQALQTQFLQLAIFRAPNGPIGIGASLHLLLSLRA